MLKTRIVLPDGTSISSGSNGTSIISSTVTRSVNSGTELTLGSTCAAMAEIKILVNGTDVLISAGDEIEVYKVLDDGTNVKIGLFTCEKPEVNRSMLTVTAYDRVSWLDKDVTGWLSGLTGWPYTLYELTQMVISHCGLTFKNTEIPNGTYRVQKFLANGVTGRDIVQWAAQAAGRFCTADPDGVIEFKWYTPAGKAIGTQSADGVIPYYMGSFRKEDYTVKKVEKVQIQFSDSDVGTVYPDIPGQKNTYRITGNYLLTAQSPTALLPIAQTIYNQLKDIEYTPCSVEIPAGCDIEAGNTVSVTGADGAVSTVYVMQKKQTGSRDSIECTGSRSRDATTAVNNRKFGNLQGKILDLKTNVDGISARVEKVNTTLSGDLQEFSDTVTGQIDDIYDQLDGVVETWYGEVVPTLDNPPANGWTTEDEKKKHSGDLYYVTGDSPDGGKAYRWVLLNGSWKWDKIANSDIAQALEAAQHAQDTADHKRRVFVSTPYTPYDEGDLWTQGSAGELMRCNHSRQTGDYVSSDWGVATDTGSRFEETTRQISAVNVRADNISAEVSTVKSNKLDKNGGSSQSFGWVLTDSDWTVKGNGEDVFKVKQGGAYVKGEIRADRGKIGGFDIGDSLSTNGATYRDATGGIYIGPSGINLNEKFYVNYLGEFHATNAHITGEITAKSGTIGGFDIGDSLSTDGASWDNVVRNGIYIGKFGIRVGENVAIGSNGHIIASDGEFTGVVHATDGDFTGTVYANSGYFKGELRGAHGTFDSLSTTSGNISFNGISLSPQVVGGESYITCSSNIIAQGRVASTNSFVCSGTRGMTNTDGVSIYPGTKIYVKGGLVYKISN